MNNNNQVYCQWSLNLVVKAISIWDNKESFPNKFLRCNFIFELNTFIWRILTMKLHSKEPEAARENGGPRQVTLQGSVYFQYPDIIRMCFSTTSTPHQQPMQWNRKREMCNTVNSVKGVSWTTGRWSVGGCSLEWWWHFSYSKWFCIKPSTFEKINF